MSSVHKSTTVRSFRAYVRDDDVRETDVGEHVALLEVLRDVQLGVDVLALEAARDCEELVPKLA